MSRLEIPKLKTDRLELVPLSLLHRDGMFALWSDEKVTKYSGKVVDYEGNEIVMPAETLNESDKIIDFWIKAAQDGWGFRWAVILSNENKCFAGTVGFNSVDSEYEIAFHLLSSFWGKGIMTEASHVAINWAKERGAESIAAFIEPENGASVKLAQRLDLKPTDEISNGARKYLKTINMNETEEYVGYFGADK